MCVYVCVYIYKYENMYMYVVYLGRKSLSKLVWLNTVDSFFFFTIFK